MSSKDVLFVSWCPLKLLRPRAFQVGRAGKALRRHKWRPYLICSKFENYLYLLDAEIESWYRPQFVKIIAETDPDFLEDFAQQNESQGSVLARLQARYWKSEPLRPWKDSATRAAVGWARWRQHPVVISFAQPWTSHLAVLAAKAECPGLRWAAHFSDPWVDSPYLAHEEGTKLEIARQQEREIIEQADAIVFVTEETADLVMRKYPRDWRAKVHVIPHLLDLDLPPVPKPQRCEFDRLRFVHSGSLYEGTRAPGGLFEALRDLQRLAQPSNLPLTFHFVGWAGSQTIKAVADLGLRESVSWTSPLYYSPSLKAMADAEVLVVIDADFEVSPFLPSKIFDYLLFDKPMLGLTPPGSATARFLEGLGYPCVGPNNVEEIKRVLMTMVDMWRAGLLKPTAAHIEARGAYDVNTAGMRYVELVERLSQ